MHSIQMAQGKGGVRTRQGQAETAGGQGCLCPTPAYAAAKFPVWKCLDPQGGLGHRSFQQGGKSQRGCRGNPGEEHPVQAEGWGLGGGAERASRRRQHLS